MPLTIATTSSIVEVADAAGSSATTYTMNVGDFVRGSIFQAGDQDYYRVTLTAGHTYAFAEIGTGGGALNDTVLKLYSSGGTLLKTDDNSGPHNSSLFTYTPGATGTYYIDAAAITGTGQYGITVTDVTGASMQVPTLNLEMAAGAIDGFARWNDVSGAAPGTPTTVTVGFRASPASYTVDGHNISTFTRVTPNEIASVKEVLKLWSDVANVTFDVNDNYTDHAAILIGNYNHPGDGYGAFAYNPYSPSDRSDAARAGDVWFNLGGGFNKDSAPAGSSSWETMIHELGHSIGFGHPGDYNAAPGVSITYAKDAEFYQDSKQYTIMSYFDGSSTGQTTNSAPLTPMLLDVYELQQIYGANMSTRAGDTVYGFHSTADRDVFNFATNPSANVCIWDGGGFDTLDCSGFGQTQMIDLKDGSFSSVGGQQMNLSIAFGAYIEKAIGGSGQDTMYASVRGSTLEGGGNNDYLYGAAGSDRLVGGAGVDTMWGDAGADTFVFAAGDSSAASGQHDLIRDFQTGVDHIDLSAIDAIPGTAAVDPFRFLGMAGFDGGKGELYYAYNSTTNITTLYGDTNSDKVADFAIDFSGKITLNAADLIGTQAAAPVTIESFGATQLLQSGGNYFLNPVAGGTGPTLTRGGAPVVVGQFSPFDPIGAEKTATGYDIAWKVAGADQYIVWQVDNNGNFVANLTSVVGGNDAGLKSLESVFHQDLNGDGVTGTASSTVIETAGATFLTQTGNNYFLNTSSGTGPELMRGGAAVAAGQFSPFAPIGAEKTATGYDVAWKAVGADQYIVWQVDNNGNFVANLTNVVGGNDAGLKSLESVFHQDLNGDGVTGAPSSTVIESAGTTFLTQTGNNYQLATSGGTGPLLMRGGAAVTAGQFAPFAPIGAEKTATGYDVAWKAAGADQYIVWQVDNNGNFVANLTNVVAGNDAGLKSLENVFHQDLNSDGTIGSPPPGAIETAGVTFLTQTNNNYFLNTSSGTGPELMRGGAAVTAGQFSPFAPIGAEKTATGYDVAWKATGADQYIVWQVDNNGNFVANLTNVVAGNDAGLKSLENVFHQDLNGDGSIGVPAATTVMAQASGAAPAVSASADAFVFLPSLGTGAAATTASAVYADLHDHLVQSAELVSDLWHLLGQDQPSALHVDALHDLASGNGVDLATTLLSDLHHGAIFSQ